MGGSHAPRRSGNGSARVLMPGAPLCCQRRVIGDEGFGFPARTSDTNTAPSQNYLSLTSGLSLSGEAWYGDTTEMLMFNTARAPAAGRDRHRLSDNRYAWQRPIRSRTVSDFTTEQRGASSTLRRTGYYRCRSEFVWLLPRISARCGNEADRATLYGECVVDVCPTVYPYDHRNNAPSFGCDNHYDPARFRNIHRIPATTGMVNEMHVESAGAETKAIDGYVSVSKHGSGATQSVWR